VGLALAATSQALARATRRASDASAYAARL